MYDKDISDTIDRVFNTPDAVYLTVFDICNKLQELRDAVRKHRDERGHDRCWLDDKELYKALGDPINEEDFKLPPKCEFAKECEKYWASRQPDANLDKVVVGDTFVWQGKEYEALDIKPDRIIVNDGGYYAEVLKPKNDIWSHDTWNIETHYLICEKLNLIPYWKFKRRVELEKKEQEHLEECRLRNMRYQSWATTIPLSLVKEPTT